VPDLDAKVLHKVLYRDIDMFARLVMPEYFSVPFGEFHKEIFEVWDSDEEFVLLIMPRGWGKTTLVQMLLLREGVYQRSKFPLLVSDTYDQAEEKLEALKSEYEENERITEFFGDQCNKKHWLKANFQINSGTVYKAKGAGQSMRGIKHKSQRPDMILVDDIENDEMVATYAQREKLHKWFHATLLPSAVRQGRRVRVVGTIVESASFLSTIMEQTAEQIKNGEKPTWKILRFGELGPDGESIWPAFRTTEAILKEKKLYQDANRLDIWMRERMSTITSDSGRLPAKHLRLLELSSDDLWALRMECHSVIVSHDPAISTNPKADRTAIVVIGFKGNDVILLAGHRQVGMPPDEQVMKALEFANYWKANAVVYEHVAFQQALKYSYERLKQNFQFIPEVVGYRVPPGSGKTLRIEHALRAPLLDERLLVAEDVYEYVHEEMSGFPNGKRDFLDTITQGINYQVENDIYDYQESFTDVTAQQYGNSSQGNWCP